MSQAKVDRYKQDKLNRRKNMQKDKIKRMIRRSVVGAVALILVGWLGYSVYDVYDTNKPQDTAEIDYSALSDYQQSLAAEDGQ